MYLYDTYIYHKGGYHYDEKTVLYGVRGIGWI